MLTSHWNPTFEPLFVVNPRLIADCLWVTTGFQGHTMAAVANRGVVVIGTTR